MYYPIHNNSPPLILEFAEFHIVKHYIPSGIQQCPGSVCVIEKRHGYYNYYDMHTVYPVSPSHSGLVLSVFALISGVQVAL